MNTIGSLAKASIVCLVAVAAIALPASAGAAQRHASPTGSGDPNTCLAAAPCSLIDATHPAYTEPGDEVILAPGTYSPGAAIGISQPIDVHGTGSPDLTHIVSDQVLGVAISHPDATLRNVTVDHSVGGNGALLGVSGTVSNSKFISSGAVSCSMRNVVIRDSFCINTGASGTAASINDGGAATYSSVLRNVTAVSTGSGSIGLMVLAATGLAASVDGLGVIAGGVANDVVANVFDLSGATVTITLAKSNFSSFVAYGGANIVNGPSAAGNQSAEPAFTNAGGGDFHQAAGSPTIDAGAIDGSSGTTDFDGEARTMGAAPDIGADEFFVAAPLPVPPGPPADTAAPQTRIVKKPKRKTTLRRAKFTFSSDEAGSTFRCKLDRGAYRACRSSYTKRVKPGKHIMRVYAIDAAGNADASPAVWRWRVLR